jgi:hypothetical protein
MRRRQGLIGFLEEPREPPEHFLSDFVFSGFS